MGPYRFTVHAVPRVKGRPRVTKTGHTYTPKATKEAEAALAAAYEGPRYTGPVAVHMRLFADRYEISIGPAAEKKRPLRGDLDNYIKILDGLNGVAWDDDIQIVHITAEFG